MNEAAAEDGVGGGEVAQGVAGAVSGVLVPDGEVGEAARGEGAAQVLLAGQAGGVGGIAARRLWDVSLALIDAAR